MGIGNTTSAAAVICALTGQSAEHIVGSGTGIDDKALIHKRAVVSKALDRHLNQSREPGISFCRHWAV